MNKRTRIVLLLLALLLLLGCAGNGSAEEAAFRRSEVWSLASRYDAEYSTISYFIAYRKGNDPFRMLISRSEKPAGSSKNVIESYTDGGIECALCRGTAFVNDVGVTFTLYECFDGRFRYRIGIEEDGYHVEDVLSFEEAIALIASPETPPNGIDLTEREWNAYFRTDSCNLEVLLCPEDGGKLLRALPSSFSAKTVDGETIYVSNIGDAIIFTDGTNSVEIRQANRVGTDPTIYNTLTECKALLALLETK